MLIILFNKLDTQNPISSGVTWPLTNLITQSHVLVKATARKNSVSTYIQRKGSISESSTKCNKQYRSCRQSRGMASVVGAQRLNQLLEFYIL